MEVAESRELPRSTFRKWPADLPLTFEPLAAEILLFWLPPKAFSGSCVGYVSGEGEGDVLPRNRIGDPNTAAGLLPCLGNGCRRHSLDIGGLPETPGIGILSLFSLGPIGWTSHLDWLPLSRGLLTRLTQDPVPPFISDIIRRCRLGVTRGRAPNLSSSGILRFIILGEFGDDAVSCTKIAWPSKWCLKGFSIWFPSLRRDVERQNGLDWALDGRPNDGWSWW